MFVHSFIDGNIFNSKRKITIYNNIIYRFIWLEYHVVCFIKINTEFITDKPVIQFIITMFAVLNNSCSSLFTTKTFELSAKSLIISELEAAGTSLI